MRRNASPGWPEVRQCGILRDELAWRLAGNLRQRETVMVLTIDAIRKAVLPILRRHNVTRAGIFGSCARGEVTDDSDVDLLVEINSDIGLLDFVGIKLEIEEALGREVDLVEYDTIKPLLKDRILQEQVQIL